MENMPEFRMVGTDDKEAKAEAKKESEDYLERHVSSLSPEERQFFEKYEIPKTEEQKSLIDFANEETNRLRQEGGLPPYVVPTENYHILPTEKYREMNGHETSGITSYMSQSVCFDAEKLGKNILMFGSTAFHETLHLKGHTSFEVEIEEDPKEKTEHRMKSNYRVGVSVISSQKKIRDEGEQHRHFNGLNEAIIATEEKKLLPKLLERPEIKSREELPTSIERTAILEKFCEAEKISVEEIMDFKIDEEEKVRSYVVFPYLPQRKVLLYVCAEIAKDFPEQYGDAEAVRKEFTKAHFTGRLLPLARLTESAFGKGSFRILGDIGIDENSGMLGLEAMQKLRNKKS